MSLFDAREKHLNPEEYVFATYQFITTRNPLDASLELCKSQSTSSADWGHLSRALAETDDIIDRHGAKLVNLESFEEVFHRRSKVLATVALPVINLHGSLAQLQTALSGEVGYLNLFETIKLEEIRFPSSFLQKFSGPKFGITGIRERLAVYDRPLVLAVIKPSIGISDHNLYATLAYQALLGGADIVKDDELLSDEKYSPLEERVKTVAMMVRKAEQVTGKPKMYLASITCDDPVKAYSKARPAGADAIMINAWTMGLSTAYQLTKVADIPVFSHFDNRWIYGKSGDSGVSYKVIALLDRIAGIDAVIMPSPKGCFNESVNDIKKEYAACTQPLGHLKSSLVCVGGSLSPVTLPENHALLGTNDIGYIVGHGIFSHPDGAEAGTHAVVQALGIESASQELFHAQQVYQKFKSNFLCSLWDNIPVGYKLLAGATALSLVLYTIGDKPDCPEPRFEPNPLLDNMFMLTCPQK